MGVVDLDIGTRSLDDAGRPDRGDEGRVRPRAARSCATMTGNRCAATSVRQQLEAVSMRIPVTVKVLLKVWLWFGSTHR